LECKRHTAGDYQGIQVDWHRAKVPVPSVGSHCVGERQCAPAAELYSRT
jgi:hypothetical protein